MESEAEAGSGQMTQPKQGYAAVLVGIVPFFLSALFFLSAIFTLFAPLPLLLLRIRSGRGLAALAALTNAALIFGLAGKSSLIIYGVSVVLLAAVMSEAIERLRSLERVAFVTWGILILTAVLSFLSYSKVHQVHPTEYYRAQMAGVLDYIQQTQSASQGAHLSGAEWNEWREGVMSELPSALAIFALVMVWANLMSMLRLSPVRVRERLGLGVDYVRLWKTPEWLVFPVIVSGFFQLVTVPLVSEVCLNVFRVLMTLYAIQGLSILSFLFDVWKIQGFFRTTGFLIAIFVMMPLLLAIGFFDLWFDFRSKLRQSYQG